MSVSPMRILLVVEDGMDSRPIEEALPPGSTIQTGRLAGTGMDVLLSSDAGRGAELVIVGCVGLHAPALEVIDLALSERGDRPVIALCAGSPNGFMEQAFAAGADDLIALPQSRDELAFALEKVIARRRRAASAVDGGGMITVLGPKGGTGKTLTSCNLAVGLAQTGRSCLIVDLDLQFGDVGLALGLRPVHTIYDLVASGGSLDADKVDSFVTRHHSGVRALLAPLRPDQAAFIDVAFLRTLFQTLRSDYDVVVVDTPPAFNPEVIAAIDAASHLCLVGMLDALSLKDTKIGLETLVRMGYASTELTLVLNRADTSVGISQSDIVQLLGRAPDVLIPSDRAIPRAITEGETIIEAEPRSEAARAFMTLAAKLSAEQPSVGADEFGGGNDVQRRSRLRAKVVA